MESSDAVRSLGALAQETRLAIYRLLVQAGPTGLSVGEVGGELSVAPATLSFHLKELAGADLVIARQQGRYIYYAASYARMNALLAFLSEKCCIRDCGSCEPDRDPRRPARRRAAKP